MFDIIEFILRMTTTSSVIWFVFRTLYGLAGRSVGMSIDWSVGQLGCRAAGRSGVPSSCVQNDII